MSKRPKIEQDYGASKDKLTITIHRYSLKSKKTNCHNRKPYGESRVTRGFGLRHELLDAFIEGANDD